MDTEILERRIRNVETARKNVQSEWGKNYWDGVLAYLLRQANKPVSYTHLTLPTTSPV